MPENNAEMNFCRRCGVKLTHVKGPRYGCQRGHAIFNNANPAVALAIINDKNEVLILERAVEPGKGMWDLPGGFCDGAESFEAAAEREVAEETGLSAEDYTVPEFVLTGVDSYDYGGELLPVLDGVFMAHMRSGKRPVAADDAAAALWVPLDKLDLGKVAFPSVRAGLAHIIKTRK